MTFKNVCQNIKNYVSIGHKYIGKENNIKLILI